MDTHPREGVMKEKFPNTRKPSHWQVYGEFWNLRGQHNRERGKKQKTTEYAPNCNSQQRSSPEICIHYHEVGAEQGGPLKYKEYKETYLGPPLKYVSYDQNSLMLILY